MATDEEKTMKLVTNLDRKAIEGKLAQVRSDAQSANLKELADKPQHNRIASQLELVGINLHNLK